MLHRIVLTGGPCGGKTTAMSRLADRLESLGFRVFLAPEVATMMFSGGVSLADCDSAQVAQIETAMVRLQMELEDAFHHAAQAHDLPTVLLMDRGCLDFKAYVPEDMWRDILNRCGPSTEGALRDERYDAVVHLVTAAEGAEQFYTLDNNVVRTESPERARELDRRLQAVWTGHPHLRVVGNESDFEDKIRRVLAAVCRVIGVPEPLEIERKFLVKSVSNPLPVHAVTAQIEQVYLVQTEIDKWADGRARIRKRTSDGHQTYTHTVKRPCPGGGRFETEERITAWEYSELLSQLDPYRRIIQKTRTCFVWEGTYYELDRFQDPAGLVLLEVETDEEGQEVRIPPFIEIEADVTDLADYSNAELARV